MTKGRNRSVTPSNQLDPPPSTPLLKERGASPTKKSSKSSSSKHSSPSKASPATSPKASILRSPLGLKPSHWSKELKEVEVVTSQGWKFMSCSHCQELGQQASWLLTGCTRVNNQSEARSAS